MPTPAIAGLKLFPFTPGPDQVPPAGVAPDRFTKLEPEHIAGYVGVVTTGIGCTVMVRVAESVQPPMIVNLYFMVNVPTPDIEGSKCPNIE